MTRAHAFKYKEQHWSSSETYCRD